LSRRSAAAPASLAPRVVKGKPFFRIQGATAWTTLALTIRADGSSDHEVVGASAFPRHWVYDRDGNLTHKAGTIDFKKWYREAHGERTPWGNEDSDAFVTQAESALERQISADLMRRGATVRRRKLEEDETLVEEEAPAEELYLVLDGVLAAEVGGEEIAQVDPGAILGESAVVGGGKRRNAPRLHPCAGRRHSRRSDRSGCARGARSRTTRGRVI
jgi:Cyclic nucleotide-binding domain